MKFWLVWNGNKERIDFPIHPHFSLSEAREEAERLARLYRGQEFSVMELIGKVRIADTLWEYPEKDEIPF